MLEFHESCGKPIWDKKDIRPGEKNPHSKLNDEIVRFIRSLYPANKIQQIQKQVKERYGIEASLGCISNVAYKLTWRHVK